MFNNLFNEFECEAISGLSKELNFLYLYNYFLKKDKNILVVTNTLYDANIFYQGLLNYTENVLFFPMDDFVTSEAISISPEFKTSRISTINILINSCNNNNKYIVVTCLMGLLRYLPLPNIWKNNILNLKVNSNFDRNKLINDLYNMGYVNESVVTKTGEMAIRGYIIDIFPVDFEFPVRIEFWGDTIDSVRFFDVNTQLSKEDVDRIEIYPYSEFLLEEYKDDVLRKQKYLKYYNKNVGNICSYLDKYDTFFYNYNQLISGYDRLYDTIVDYKKNNDDILDVEYMNRLDDMEFDNVNYILDFDSVVDNKNVNIKKYDSTSIINYNGNFIKLKDDLLKYYNSNKTIIVCFNNKNSLKRVYDELSLSNIVISNENNLIDKNINFIVKKINNGFIFNNYVVIGEANIFDNIDSNVKYKNKFKLGTKIKNIKNISDGDYIVHDIHGICIYRGIVTLTKNGLKKDYIKLAFSGNDVLYVPVEKIDKINKYSSKEGVVPKINKLGSSDFQKTKLRLKKKLQDIAAKLLKIYAERESTKGYAFSKDDENQIIFESEFEYKETEDQLLMSRKIKDEMEKKTPMDMLLCGDVGYGKTEVAFRAIFKAVNDGKQVAYLCPTTILSNQQYKNALKRFKNFPINIELLNRFVSVKEQNNIIKRLAEGKVDILFGTHRILSNDIKFKDLGLLVIDEEQRFGVTHKEKIKEYKTNVDVLTLSATPIPRTLQMSMTGIRSLALIETPPVDRYPIQTYVLPENKSVIKDAIYRELSRGGQVFLLYNKVSNIEARVSEIKQLVPEARIDFAHGQMSKDMLENKMQNFINHNCDVLVCTTIIETGIDIPNVNTLIIIDADCFGLSQLYQIRGRIGRSNKIGYAYLMYNNHKELNDIAVKRLNTIKEFTELGSGFKIAMRDLSIRGAGDILGAEQSGFIDTVGIDLYLKMLNETVNELKGEPVSEESESDEVKPLIDVATHISDDYLVDDNIKIEIHKKINEVDSYDKLLEIKSELEDRFGKISSDMEIYMYEEWFEKLAKKLNIKQVNQTKNYIEIVLSKELTKKIDGESLFFDAYEICKSFRFSYKFDRISIIIDTIKLKEHYLIYVNKLLTNIINKLGF